MNITQEKTGNLSSLLKLQLKPEDYKTQVSKVFNSYAREANIPGFRPGKVPVGMIKKMVGKGPVIEEISKIVSKTLHSYILDNKLNVLGEPLPVKLMDVEGFSMDLTDDVDLEFELGLAPDFDVNYGIGSKPVFYNIVIDEPFLNKEIDALKERFGEVTNPDKVEKGDIIYGTLLETDDKGNAVEEGFKKMIVLNPARVNNEKFFKQFIGKEISFKTPVDIFTVAETEEEIKKLTFLDDSELEAIKGKQIEFDLTRINRTSLAEMNGDFFAKVLGDESIKTEEDFREKLAEQIENSLDQNTLWHLRGQIRRGLVETNDFDLPEEFLKKWILESTNRHDHDHDQQPGHQHKHLTAEEVEEKWADEYKPDFRWQLIISKLEADNEDLRVSEEELDNELLDSYRKYFGGEVDEDTAKGVISSLKQNNEVVGQALNRLSADKIFNFLSDEVGFEEKEISATDFSNLEE